MKPRVRSRSSYSWGGPGDPDLRATPRFTARPLLGGVDGPRRPHEPEADEADDEASRDRAGGDRGRRGSRHPHRHERVRVLPRAGHDDDRPGTEDGPGRRGALAWGPPR